MSRPVKWSRDLHPIRDRAQRARTETWSRQDIERLFSVSRPSAQSLMKAIGEVQSIGAAHFVDRSSLLGFLNEMIAADSVEEALRLRQAKAAPAPRSRPLRVSLPAGLRATMLPDLPDAIRLEPGRLTVEAGTAEAMLELLALLAQAIANDLERFRSAVEQPSEQEPLRSSAKAKRTSRK